MSLKKVKRVLAVSLAVMLAIPPNVYGGPLVARAEEDDSGAAAERYMVTEISDSYKDRKELVENEKWLKGTSEEDIINSGCLPTTIDVKIQQVQKQESSQVLTEEKENAVVFEEETGVTEAHEASDETETGSVQKSAEEEKVTADVHLDESEKEEPAVVSEEPVESPQLEEEKENVENTDGEVKEEPEAEGNATIFSDIVGLISDLLPEPMVVYAAEAGNIEEEWTRLTIKTWTYNEGEYIFTPVIEGYPNIDWADTDPTISIRLAKNTVGFSDDELYIFPNETDYNELLTDDGKWALFYVSDKLSYKSSDSNVAEVSIERGEEFDDGYFIDYIVVQAKNPGTAKITAVYYGEEIISFDVIVPDPKAGYTVINGNSWTNDKVYIRANEGYSLIDLENENDDKTEYLSEIAVDVKDGEYLEETYRFGLKYDKAEDGGVTEQYVDCKIDKVAPYGIIRTVSHSWDKLVDASDAEGQEIRETTNPQFYIEGSDLESGLASIQYHIFDNYVSKDPAAIEKAVAADGGWKIFEDKWTDLDFNSYHVVYGKLTDNVGNVTYISSARMEILGYFPLNATAELRGVTDSSARIQITGEYDSDVYQYYLLNTTTDVTMSPQQVMAQGMSSRTGTFNLTGLNANTTYYAYAVIQDYDDAISDVMKVTFTTAQADTLQSMTVSGIKAQAYTGKAICPKITVKDAATGKKLTQGKQYTVSYENNVNAGIGVIVITAVNGSGYEGTKRVYFNIDPQNIAKKVQAKVVGKKFLFTGDPVMPSVSVTYSKMGLAEGRDYELSYENNIAKGNATIYITGKGNYTGTKAIKFKIAGPKIKDAEVSLTADSAVYSGANSFPGVIVKYNGKICQEGVDYTVKYPKKLKAGKNAISIIGKGNLSGSVKRNFIIEKAPMENVEVSMQTSLQLTGKSMKVLPNSVTLDGNALTNKDYTIKYRSAATGKMSATIKEAGAYQLVLTGKGCYQGTKVVDFTVTEGAAQAVFVQSVVEVIENGIMVQTPYNGTAMKLGKTLFK